MPGRSKWKWPSDDDLVALYTKHGSIQAVAAALKVPRTSLASYAYNRADLRSRFQAVQQELEDTTPAAGPGIADAELLRQRLRELEQQVRRYREDEVGEERVLRRLEAALAERVPTPTRAARVPARAAKSTPHEMALLLSDTHAYEVVSSTETLGMNEYNRDVLLKRMARLQERVLSYVQHRPYSVSKLHIWMLGDMLSGDIHEELAQTNELAHEESVVQFALDTAEWLRGFLPHFDEVLVAGVPGNHPRRSKKPQAKGAVNNSDWTAYKIIEIYLRNEPQIKFEFPRAHYATITAAERWRVLLMHGDGIRSSMPGVPWGGVIRRITVLEQQFNKAKQPLDYVCLGHFHTANALDGVGVKTFMNGSVKGLDEYSMKQFGSGRAPAQLLLTFHREHGVTDVSYLDLVDQRPAAA